MNLTKEQYKPIENRKNKLANELKICGYVYGHYRMKRMRGIAMIRKEAKGVIDCDNAEMEVVLYLRKR